MINIIVKEVRFCLEHECYLSALIAALILPDICGKAAFPEDKKRYTKWFDEHIGKYESPKDTSKKQKYLNGELVYNLRCSLLHEGNPNVCKKKTGIENFILTKSKSIINFSIATWEKEDRHEFIISINEICNKICACAEVYYENNKEKFKFFNYNIVDEEDLSAYNRRSLS